MACVVDESSIQLLVPPGCIFIFCFVFLCYPLLMGGRTEHAAKSVLLFSHWR